MSALESAALAYADAHAVVGRTRAALHQLVVAETTCVSSLHAARVASHRAKAALAQALADLRRAARISAADA
jgi:hypothetical protein